MSPITLPRRGREVLKAFKTAGLDVDVRPASKHYLVYHKGELVYKFGQGTTVPRYADKALASVIRSLSLNG